MKDPYVDPDEVDDLDVYIAEQMQNPQFAGAYADAETRAALLAGCVKARKNSGLTQTDVARIMETTQSAVSEFEGGGTDPRLSTLQRYARAIGAEIVVSLNVPSRTR